MDPKPNLTYPTLHLNGTSKDMLVEGYADAYAAVNNAISVIEKIEFNARDYYPQGPEAWKKAREEHVGRAARLKAVADELLAIAMHVQDSAGGR